MPLLCCLFIYKIWAISTSGSFSVCYLLLSTYCFSRDVEPAVYDSDGNLFIDRNPAVFEKVLDFLRTDRFPRFDDKDDEFKFMTELKYFRIKYAFIFLIFVIFFLFWSPNALGFKRLHLLPFSFLQLTIDHNISLS